MACLRRALAQARRNAPVVGTSCAGFDERKDLYTLYHYLNHYNLFGGSYRGQCEAILTKLTRGL